MKRILFAISAVVLAVMTAAAAYPQHIKVTTPQGQNVTVVALNKDVIKVINTPAGVTATAGGHTSVLDESDQGPCLNPGGSGMKANFGGVQVTVTRNGQVTIDGGKGKTVTDNGLRLSDKGRQVLVLDTDFGGSWYGAGERGHRRNLRGDTLVMYNRQNYGYTGSDPRISQMNITMPLVLSDNGFALVFDDFGAATMVLGDDNVQYITETPAPVSWYYVSGGSSLAETTTALTGLTGRQDLPPAWTLGYITSKYGYKTQTEAEDMVDSLRAAGYPLDGIVLDLYWYGKEQDMGRLAWDPEQWPDPKGMLDYFKQKGVHLIPISQPYVLRNGRAIDNYNELAPKGLFVADSTGRAPQEVTIWVGEGGMWDMSNPDTRAWLSNRYKELTDMGVGGWWGDLGEPEVHPETALHHNGLTARLYHNVYGNDWSKIIYDLYRQQYPDRRLISMMRGGTTGLQRYDVFPWSTDVSRSWGGLEPQVRIMLGSGLSGLGYMGHDVGGFAVDPEHPYDPELYVRWLQLGTFSPMLRTHAQEFAEPIHYPEQQDIIKRFINERYRWMPYNYTLAWENATKGWPLVRPLDFHMAADKKDANYDTISDEYLWGRDVLVAPVMTQGTTQRDIVLPAGSDWVDLANPDKVYKGGTTVKDYPAPLDVLPMFVRQGTLLPTYEQKVKSVRDYDNNRYTVSYYPGAKAVTECTLFEDDMTLPTSVTANDGRLITMTGDDTAKNTTVTFSSEGSYGGAANQKTITLVVYGQKDKPRSVTANKRNVRYTYNKEAHTVTVSFVWKLATPLQISLNH